MQDIETILDSSLNQLTKESQKISEEIENINLITAELVQKGVQEAALIAKKIDETMINSMKKLVESISMVVQSIQQLEKSVNESHLLASSASISAIHAGKEALSAQKNLENIHLALADQQKYVETQDLRNSIKSALTYASETNKKISETVTSTEQALDKILILKSLVSLVVKKLMEAEEAAKIASTNAASSASQAASNAAEAASKASINSATAASLAVKSTKKLLVDISNLNRSIHSATAAKMASEIADKAKGSFLANMSHEIRTPLASIMGFAELLKMEFKSASNVKVQQHIDAILRNSDHLKSLIDDVLDISKIEAGKLSLELVRVSLRDELNGILETLYLKSTERGNSIQIIYAKDTPEFILTDPLRFRQILLNILGNANKFTEQGQITINIRADESGSISSKKFLVIQVIDSGCGMSPEQQKKIFESYGQADRTTTRRFGGTGLGLILSKKLAHLLGGDIFLLQSTLDKGSTFEIRLALNDPTTSLIENPKKTTTSQLHGIASMPKFLDGCKLLLAEDNTDLQMLFQWIANSAGAEVAVATNGEDAVKMALSNHFDIIVMDIEMPILDGNKANKKLRDQGYLGTIIAFTAHALKADLSLNKERFDDYITKPITFEKLIETLKKWYPPKVSE